MTDCKFCPDVTKEKWARDLTVYRCMSPEAGEWQGRVLDEPPGKAVTVTPPEWCPKRKY